MRIYIFLINQKNRLQKLLVTSIFHRILIAWIILFLPFEYIKSIIILTGMKGGKYNQWIDALVVVAFDIDEGQKVSHSVPVLTALQEKTISMLAFPDSNSVAEYEGIFKYLFKTEDDTFGFVCFKQKKDPNNKRGYSQKSFVVLTKLPFLVFFQKLAEFLVFKLFALEDDILGRQLEKINGQAEKWPDPQPLSSYILPVLDYQISVEIPNYVYDFNGTGLVKMQNFHSNRKQKKFSLEAIVTQQSLLQFGRFQEVKLTDHFNPAFEELWVLWENIILNRPFLIMADNPYKASQAVLASISLLNPLEYAGDFYPYVTVYDTHLSALQVAQQNLVFGATNPLFLKLFAGSKIKVLQLGNCKIPKHLRPLKQLFVQSKVEEQKFVNQSALRKYFYKANCGIISILEEYTEMQTNDLKFFNEKEFLRFVRKRQGENVLTQIFDSKKNVQIFWEQFVKSLNFSMLLRGRNIVREKS